MENRTGVNLSVLVPSLIHTFNGVDNVRTAKQWVHYQPLRVQYDTKACNILFIACLTFDVDIQ